MIWTAALVILLKTFPALTAQGSQMSCQGEDCATVKERNVDTESLSGGTTSVCLPDECRRVGATDGESYVTLYAFGMETLNGSSIDNVLYSVKTTLQMYLIEEYLQVDCLTLPVDRDSRSAGTERGRVSI
jgi:hypothetical protein